MMYSPMGEYIESILGAIAEHEGTQIAERIMETRIANFMSGSRREIYHLVIKSK